MSEVLHFPDVYSGSQRINFQTSYAVIAKATQGLHYTDPVYGAFQTEARAKNVFFMAYHFLEHGNAAAQADYCFKLVGHNVPLAIDAEPYMSSHPTTLDIEQFLDEYQRLGGKCFTVYLPHWYWQGIGSPDLNGLIIRNQRLWTSNYPTEGYSDNGPGWEGYGGMAVSMWQYSSTIPYGGISAVDFNAFRGTGKQTTLPGVLSELEKVVSTGIL